jgi:uncharacterized protein DUF3710
MIFRRRKKNEDVEAFDDAPADTGDGASDADPDSADEPRDEDADGAATEDVSGEPSEDDLEALDELDWRTEGPWDVSEVDLDEPADPDQPRIDLGSIIVTGFGGAELRLQVSEESQQIVSAMLISDDSAIELGAFAAPRTGGFWREFRTDIAEAATDAGGSVAFREGPFGVELNRLLPVTTPDGEQGYQPSRMWVVEGPRWILRGIVYGQAALADGVEGPVAALHDAFRKVIVRRGDQAMAPGDLLPLQLPTDLAPAEPADEEDR